MPREIIPVGRLQVATPATMAMAVRSLTDATDAVDERIQDVAATIIANDPTIIAAAEAAADEAVDSAIADANLLRAYPEDEPGYTTVADVPMSWVYRVLNTPYSDTYSNIYDGEWEGETRRRGNLPVLTQSGVISEAQIPSSIARLSDIPDVPDVPDPDPTPPPVINGVTMPPGMPIFEARLAVATNLEEPVAIAYAGSSTTAGNPGYVSRLTRLFQVRRWNDAAVTQTQWSPEAQFTERTAPGIHGYSAGQNGARAHDYLTDAECDRIAALRPAMILHMIGANDYTNQTDPAVYEATLRARLAYFDSAIEAPCQHVLVHAYAKPSFTPANYPHLEYLAALQAIADDRLDTICIDLGTEYAAVGVAQGGNDPLSLVSADGTHQTPEGNRFMNSRLADYLVP